MRHSMYKHAPSPFFPQASIDEAYLDVTSTALAELRALTSGEAAPPLDSATTAAHGRHDALACCEPFATEPEPHDGLAFDRSAPLLLQAFERAHGCSCLAGGVQLRPDCEHDRRLAVGAWLVAHVTGKTHNPQHSNDDGTQDHEAPPDWRCSHRCLVARP